MRIAYPLKQEILHNGNQIQLGLELETYRVNLMKKILKLLFEIWKLPQPNLIISVIGGEIKCKASSTQKREF